MQQVRAVPWWTSMTWLRGSRDLVRGLKHGGAACFNNGAHVPYLPAHLHDVRIMAARNSAFTWAGNARHPDKYADTPFIIPCILVLTFSKCRRVTGWPDGLICLS